MGGRIDLSGRRAGRSPEFPFRHTVSESKRSVGSCRRRISLLSPWCILVIALLHIPSLDCAITDNECDLIIPAGETYTICGSRTYSGSVEIYGRLVVAPYTVAHDSGTLKLVAPTITLHPGGIIDADRAGFHAGGGPGVGVSPPGTAGTGDVQGIPQQDMDGEVRVLGNQIDMGADECADTDADLLPDYLEMFYFESLSSGPDEDPDSDGMTTAEELVCGTDPSNSRSYLKVMEIMPLELSTMISWNGLPGRQYRVHASDNMKDWLCISPVITRGELPAVEPTFYVEGHDHPFHRRFYRIEALP